MRWKAAFSSHPRPSFAASAEILEHPQRLGIIRKLTPHLPHGGPLGPGADPVGVAVEIVVTGQLVHARGLLQLVRQEGPTILAGPSTNTWSYWYWS